MISVWAKLVVNCAINPLSAITRLPCGKMTALEGVAQLMKDIAREALAVAQAEHISVPDTVFETIWSIPVTMAGQYSSTAHNQMRGKSAEIDFLNGEIVKGPPANSDPVASPENLHVSPRKGQILISLISFENWSGRGESNARP